MATCCDRITGLTFEATYNLDGMWMARHQLQTDYADAMAETPPDLATASEILEAIGLLDDSILYQQGIVDGLVRARDACC